MSRDYKVYLADILAAVARIRRHIRRAKGDFTRDELIMDAVIRNLEVIGEAAKAVPPAVRMEHPEVEWRAISGLRDILVREYFGVDADIIRDIVQTKLPLLGVRVRTILKRSAKEGKIDRLMALRGKAPLRGLDLRRSRRR